MGINFNPHSVATNKNPPSVQSIERCFRDVATLPDTAEYALEMLKTRLKHMGMLEKSRPLIEELNQYVNDVKSQQVSSSLYWSGIFKDKTQALLHNLAVESGSQIGEANITFHFAINDGGEFVRGYGANNEELDDKTKEEMDAMLHNWLADNNLFIEDGIIYETEDGEIKLDTEGRRLTVSPEKFKQLINHSNKGFKESVRKLSNVELSMQEQVYPAPQPQQEVYSSQ